MAGSNTAPPWQLLVRKGPPGVTNRTRRAWRWGRQAAPDRAACAGPAAQDRSVCAGGAALASDGPPEWAVGRDGSGEVARGVAPCFESRVGPGCARAPGARGRRVRKRGHGLAREEVDGAEDSAADSAARVGPPCCGLDLPVAGWTPLLRVGPPCCGLDPPVATRVCFCLSGGCASASRPCAYPRGVWARRLGMIRLRWRAARGTAGRGPNRDRRPRACGCCMC
jgi:hypothetical protein